MRARSHLCLWAVSALTPLLAVPGAVAAQAVELGWSYSAQLTAVWAGGNSTSSTFGLGSSLRRLGENNEVKLDAAAIRSAASLKTRRAVGTASDHRIEEEEDHQKTAESYFARGRYDRTINDGFVVFSGVDWSRNPFAGMDSRLLLAAGAGKLWAQRDDFRFKTDLAATYSFQEDVVENPFLKSSFPGVRFSWDLIRTLTRTTKWQSALISDLNLDETDDVRVNLDNAVSLTVSDHLAVKPGLQLFWRNQPSLTEIELFTATGAATGQKVLAPLAKLDSFFTLALVVAL
jgi:hypothetical protein